MKDLFAMVPSDYFILQEDAIQIWEFPLQPIFAETCSYLDESEQIRAKRYHFEHHRQRFIAAHTMLRCILGKYLQQNPRSIEFTFNKQGKPSAVNALSLEFNLSHSGSLAILAVGKTHHLGIDIEFFSSRPYAGIGNLVFSEQENNVIQNKNATLQALMFFKCWAQKEALIKACGLGLSYPTTTFDVELSAAAINHVFDPLNQLNWHMLTFMPRIACAGALCHSPAIKNINYLYFKQKKFEEKALHVSKKI